MTTRFNGFLFDNTREGTSSPRPAVAAASGLQRLLTAVASVFTEAIIEGGSVPPGFCGRFEQAFTSPTHGGIQQLLIWLCGQPHLEKCASISLFIDQHVKTQNGWLNRMVQLRNRWAHPQGESPDAIELELEKMMKNPPDFSPLGSFEKGENGIPTWCSGDIRLPVPHLFSVGSEKVSVFHSFKTPGTLVFDEQAESQPFAIKWQELRILDDALTAVTAADFIGKARRIAHSSSGSEPWWFKEIMQRNSGNFLIAPCNVDGAICAINTHSPDAGAVDIVLENGKSPADLVASTLGLAQPPAHLELRTLVTLQYPCWVSLRAEALESKEFLKTIYWLSDLGSGNPGMRILVSRSSNRLSQDQEKLWDRLPEQLETIFALPAGKQKRNLPDFLWPEQKPKRFLGLF